MSLEKGQAVGFNKKRAGWARDGLVAFSANIGHDIDEPNGFETVAGDFIADLMHLCDDIGIQFVDILARGQHFYVEETYSTCKKCGRHFDVEADEGCTEVVCVECLKL